MLSMVFQSAQKFAFITVLFILYAIPYTLYVSPVLAQTPPEALPCERPITPDESILTHHWLANENREPPAQLHRQTITVVGPSGQEVHVREPIEFTVDFSKLGALFGPTNSNYNEGKYQDQDHKTAAIKDLGQTEISTYNGPGQKAGNAVMLDLMRIKYVSYIWENSHLPEASDEITDTNGENPKRIYDMVNDFGGQIPDSDPNTSNPTPPRFGGDENTWQNGWGKYWAKIPTTFDEFYEAYIGFREESNSARIDLVQSGGYCPDWLPQEITFVVPNYFRTTTTSGQTNQLIVPKAAQSHHSNDLILGNKDDAFLDDYRTSNQGILGKIIDTCLKAFKNNPVTSALKNVISSAVDLVNPIPSVFAQSNQSDPPDPDNCMRVLIDGKEGQDPYCAFPTQLNEGLEYTCENQIDQYKLDTDNENVICTFKIYWEPPHPMVIGDVGSEPQQWDECVPIPNTNLERCSVEVSIWPVFKIPWTTEIWNNTLFSDTENHEPFISSEEFQKRGRPGTYSFFTPVTIFEDKLENLLRS